MANHPRYNIVIDCDGDITKAYLLVDGNVVKKAMTKRNPQDKFSFRIAAETAFSRLWAKKEKKQKPVFKVGDRVVCKRCESNPFILYQHGTVRSVDGNGRVGVEFDCRVVGGHMINPYTCLKNRGHGWWCAPNDLELEAK